MFLGPAYEIQEGFEEYLNGDQRAFPSMLRVIEDNLPVSVLCGSGMGRPE